MAITTPQIVDTNLDPALHRQSKLGSEGVPSLDSIQSFQTTASQPSTLNFTTNNSNSSINSTTNNTYVYIENIIPPIGSNNSIEFVSNGALAGSNSFTFDSTSNTLHVSGNLIVNGHSNLGDLSSVTILGGGYNSVLVTDGNGNLTWGGVSFAQQPADWNAVSGSAQILNKPIIPNRVSQLLNDSGFVTSASLTYANLSGTPSLTNYATNANVSNLANQLANIAWANLVGAPNIANYITTSNVSNLIANVTWANLSGKPTLSTVTTTGSYTDLINIPNTFDGNYANLTDKPDLTIYATSSNVTNAIANVTWANLSGKPSLATVATSGSYNDLTNQPTIPTSIETLSDTSINPPSNPRYNNQVLLYNGFVWVNSFVNAANVIGLATVATTGKYSDLSGSPTNLSQFVNDLPHEPKFEFNNSDFNALSGHRYGIDTTTGTVSATLPLTPALGDAIFFTDFGGAYSTNNFIIIRNSNTIMNQTSDMTVSIDGQSFGLVWTGSTWRVYS